MASIKHWAIRLDHLYHGLPPCNEGFFTCMKDVMFNKADLLYLKPYSEQAEQLETGCLWACDVITIVAMFTIVATPIMIVAQNHNCRNCDHNCRNLVNHKVAIFQKNFDLVNVYTWLKDDASLNAVNLDSIFHNIVFIFWPANLLQYILEAYNFVLKANLAIFFCARPIASSQFLLYLWQRETFRKRNLPIYWQKYM